MKRLAVLLMLHMSARAATMADLPVFTDSNYRPSPRDPFVDASVSRTLLTSVEDRDSSTTAPPIETFEKELKELFASTHKILALAVSGENGSAVVNGRAVERGEPLIVTLPDTLGSRLLSTSQYYGLGLNAEIEAKQLSAKIERVTPEGIHIRIRGTRTPMLLEYQPQTEVEIINP